MKTFALALLAASADAFAPSAPAARTATSLASHFSTIDTQIFDKSTLLKALDDVGVKAKVSPVAGEQIEARGHRGDTILADVVIPQPNDYDVAFRYNGETYELVADLEFWQQSMPADAFMERVSQRYAVNSLIDASSQEGFNVDQVKESVDGTVTLTMSRYNVGAAAPAYN